jgi:hypothetical protein
MWLGVFVKGSLQGGNYLTLALIMVEPKKVYEALEDPDWLIAMHDKLNNFERNKVWTLVERLKDFHNVIGTN